jgi:hypothetical protein
MFLIDWTCIAIGSDFKKTQLELTGADNHFQAVSLR